MANKPVNNGIIINGKTYKVVRNNNIAGLGPNPCDLCDPVIKRRCFQPVGYPNYQPCQVFNRGHMLTHFKKVKDEK